MNRFNERTDEMKCVAEPMANLTDISKENGVMATDAMVIANRIKRHLFGDTNEVSCEKKEAQPQCFQEELLRTNSDLKKTIETLHQICVQLGV